MPRFVVLDEADHDKPLGLGEACARFWAHVVHHGNWQRASVNALTAVREGAWYVARSTMLAYSKHSYAMQCAGCAHTAEGPDREQPTHAAVGSDGATRAAPNPAADASASTASLGGIAPAMSYLHRLAWGVPHGLVAVASSCDRGGDDPSVAHASPCSATVDDDLCRLLTQEYSSEGGVGVDWTLQLQGGLVLSNHSHADGTAVFPTSCLQLNPPHVGAAFGGANAWFASIVFWTLLISLLRLAHNTSTGRKLHVRECERYKKFL